MCSEKVVSLLDAHFEIKDILYRYVFDFLPQCAINFDCVCIWNWSFGNLIYGTLMKM